MSVRHRHKSNYKSVPQKPELEITNEQSFEEQDQELETLVPGFEFVDGTSVKTGRGTDTSTEETELTAPVNIPSRESMTVNLVESDLVFRLEEYRSDESRFAALFYAFLGALIGYISTLLISEPVSLDGSKILVGALLILVSVIFLVIFMTYKLRADNKINEIKQSSTSR